MLWRKIVRSAVPKQTTTNTVLENAPTKVCGTRKKFHATIAMAV